MEEPGSDFTLDEKDIVIIGGGPAGYVAVIHTTHLGINDFQRRVRGKKHYIGLGLRQDSIRISRDADTTFIANASNLTQIAPY